MAPFLCPDPPRMSGRAGIGPPNPRWAMAGTRICPQCKQRMEATRCPKCRIPCCGPFVGRRVRPGRQCARLGVGSLWGLSRGPCDRGDRRPRESGRQLPDERRTVRHVPDAQCRRGRRAPAGPGVPLCGRSAFARRPLWRRSGSIHGTVSMSRDCRAAGASPRGPEGQGPDGPHPSPAAHADPAASLRPGRPAVRTAAPCRRAASVGGPGSHGGHCAQVHPAGAWGSGR